VSFDNTWEDEVGQCEGHLSYALTPFKNIFDSDDRLYTNSELYELLEPTIDSYPYVYDHFRWSHCEVLGDIQYLYMYKRIHAYNRFLYGSSLQHD
jgi:hypothetical protein